MSDCALTFDALTSALVLFAPQQPNTQSLTQEMLNKISCFLFFKLKSNFLRSNSNYILQMHGFIACLIGFSPGSPAPLCV